jgi:hypothetical protein
VAAAEGAVLAAVLAVTGTGAARPCWLVPRAGVAKSAEVDYAKRQ